MFKLHRPYPPLLTPNFPDSEESLVFTDLAGFTLHFWISELSCKVKLFGKSDPSILFRCYFFLLSNVHVSGYLPQGYEAPLVHSCTATFCWDWEPQGVVFEQQIP